MPNRYVTLEMFTIIIFLKNCFYNLSLSRFYNYLFAPFPSFSLASILHLILNCWLYLVSLPRYTFYLRGWLKTFNKKLYVQKNFVTSKSLCKHEVFLTKFNIAPAPSNSASLPDCSLKFPGGKGVKHTNGSSFSHLCSPLCSADPLLQWLQMPNWTDGVHFYISSIGCFPAFQIHSSQLSC